MPRTWILAPLFGLCAVAAFSASLGEVAQKEREKKKEKERKPPARVYTEADLPRPTPTAKPGEGVAAGATAASTSSSGSGPYRGGGSDEETSTPVNRAADRRAWQQRAAAARKGVEEAAMKLAQKQAELALMKSPHHRTRPFGLGNPDLPAAEADAAKAAEALDQAQKALATFQEEATAARIPSHWLEP